MYMERGRSTERPLSDAYNSGGWMDKKRMSPDQKISQAKAIYVPWLHMHQPNIWFIYPKKHHTNTTQTPEKHHRTNIGPNTGKARNYGKRTGP